MNTISLKVVTPSRLFYSGMAEYVEIETVDGKMGFMCGALPQVIALCPGTIVVKTSVLETKISNGDGMVIVDPDGITVIAETCDYVGGEASVDAVDGAEAATSLYKVKVKLASAVHGARAKKQ